MPSRVSFFKYQYSRTMDTSSLPAYRRSSLCLNIVQILPTRLYLDKLLAEGSAINKRLDHFEKLDTQMLKDQYDVFIDKIHILNINMCYNFYRLMEKGFWRVGCLEKLRVLLAWLDNDNMCWFRYKCLMQVFRNRISYILSFVEAWSRCQRRKPCGAYLQMQEPKLQAILESMPWKEARLIVWSSTEKFHQSKKWIKLSSLSPPAAAADDTATDCQHPTTAAAAVPPL